MSELMDLVKALSAKEFAELLECVDARKSEEENNAVSALSKYFSKDEEVKSSAVEMNRLKEPLNQVDLSSELLKTESVDESYAEDRVTSRYPNLEEYAKTNMFDDFEEKCQNTSKLVGKIMPDGNVYNPAIHRPKLAYKVIQHGKYNEELATSVGRSKRVNAVATMVSRIVRAENDYARMSAGLIEQARISKAIINKGYMKVLISSIIKISESLELKISGYTLRFILENMGYMGYSLGRTLEKLSTRDYDKMYNVLVEDLAFRYRGFQEYYKLDKVKGCQVKGNGEAPVVVFNLRLRDEVRNELNEVLCSEDYSTIARGLLRGLNIAKCSRAFQGRMTDEILSAMEVFDVIYIKNGLYYTIQYLTQFNDRIEKDDLDKFKSTFGWESNEDTLGWVCSLELDVANKAVRELSRITVNNSVVGKYPISPRLDWANPREKDEINSIHHEREEDRKQREEEVRKWRADSRRRLKEMRDKGF